MLGLRHEALSRTATARVARRSGSAAITARCFPQPVHPVSHVVLPAVTQPEFLTAARVRYVSQGVHLGPRKYTLKLYTRKEAGEDHWRGFYTWTTMSRGVRSSREDLAIIT